MTGAGAAGGAALRTARAMARAEWDVHRLAIEYSFDCTTLRKSIVVLNPLAAAGHRTG